MRPASAFGAVFTHPSPTSRGLGCCGSVLMGRWWELTAASPRAGACRLRAGSAGSQCLRRRVHAPKPTSRGLGCCGSFRMGRRCVQTAVLGRRGDGALGGADRALGNVGNAKFGGSAVLGMLRGSRVAEFGVWEIEIGACGLWRLGLGCLGARSWGGKRGRRCLPLQASIQCWAFCCFICFHCSVYAAYSPSCNSFTYAAAHGCVRGSSIPSKIPAGTRYRS